MKVKEVLELTLTKNTAAIAKDHLTIGEKTLRTALKAAECTSGRGKKGWQFEGSDTTILEKSIYEFAPTRKRQVKAINNASIDASKEIATASEVTASKRKPATNRKPAKASKQPIQSDSDMIDRLLSQDGSNSNQRIYRGFYWDQDIIEVIDSVKHGNKSDLMNEIVRTVLTAKGYLKS